MTRPDAAARHTIRIEVDGRTLAEARVERTDRPGTVHSDLHLESGPIPSDTGARLVDAVLDDPDVSGAERLVATMPLGNTTMLVVHCVETRRFTESNPGSALLAGVTVAFSVM